MEINADFFWPKKKVSIDQKITIMNTDVISGKNKSLNGISLILSKKRKRGGNDAKIKWWKTESFIWIILPFDISFKSLPINTCKQQPKKLPILE